MELQRHVWVKGEMGSGGWSPARPDDPDAQRMSMTLAISELKGGFLFEMVSDDRAIYGDSWFETLDEAMAAAEEDFGVTAEEWDQ